MDNRDQENQPLTQDVEQPATTAQRVQLKQNLDGCDQEEQFFCANCQKDFRSVINHRYGLWTYLCCFIWCFLTFFCGLVPFIWNKCQDVEQTCPQCHKIVGKKEFKPCC